MLTKSNTPDNTLWTRTFITVAAANFLLFFSFYQLLPILPLYIIDKFQTDNATRYVQPKAAILLDIFRIYTLLFRLQDSRAVADSSGRAFCTRAVLWHFEYRK